MPFAAAWRDLEIIMLSEVNQTEKDQYHMRSLICGILKKKKKIQKELIHRTETDSQISKPNSFFWGGVIPVAHEVPRREVESELAADGLHHSHSNVGSKPHL